MIRDAILEELRRKHDEYMLENAERYDPSEIQRATDREAEREAQNNPPP